MERRLLTDENYRILRLAPFWVLSAIVGRHRNFHPLEVEALRRAVEDAGRVHGGVVLEVLGTVASDPAPWLREFESEAHEPPVWGLNAVVDALSALDADVALLFRTTLLELIGAGMARARGPFGQMITQSDRDTLELLAGVLDVELMPQDGAA